MTASQDFIRQKAAVMSRAIEEIGPGYDCQGGGNPIAVCSGVPVEAQVLRVLRLLDEVFFPGYRSDCAGTEDLVTYVIERLDEAYDILYRQVKRAIPLRWSAANRDSGTLEAPLDDSSVSAEAARTVDTLFTRIPAIREMLKLDVIAAYHGDPAAKSYSEVILSYPGLRAITVYRVAHELYLLNVPLIPRLMTEWIHAQTGIEIHPGARIGESFFIDHGSGVVIGETTEIGNRVRIYQGVTLGAYSFPLDERGNPIKGLKRHPTIEDDVVIYPGATILGGETVVGSGAVIGGNVWLTRSVPSHTTVTLRLDGGQFTQVAKGRKKE